MAKNLIFDIWRAALEACSATWNLGTSLAASYEFSSYLTGKHITSPLQSPTGQCCLGKELLFTVRITRNTQIQSEPHRIHIKSPLQGPTG
jgi:hypothetical protein